MLIDSRTLAAAAPWGSNLEPRRTKDWGQKPRLIWSAAKVEIGAKICKIFTMLIFNDI